MEALGRRLKERDVVPFTKDLARAKFMYAARRGNLYRLQELITNEGADVNWTDKVGDYFEYVE